MRKTLFAGLLGSALLFTAAAHAADYTIDTQGAHASIDFKISHLGYSFVVGRFNEFEGTFSFDKDAISNAKFNVTVKTESIDSNQAERDKHLRGDAFLDVSKYPQAKFASTSVTDKGDGKFAINGDLTLHGVTKPVTIDAEYIGEGKDPWGGYRAGFVGSTEIALKDFGIDSDLGPASTHVTLNFVVEGVKK
ncbi:YceI family protein [Shewanella sp. C32]|uniref:YceI family protein n=1 Tax=Shewanella electrica TaxID=515560 RepID=A0ABT2FFF6_9GAMM|nr:YceI family protein [Shewanella electrica]MCH1925172.1 YceI family protein [Shewanella electrica]MCS4554997.1 YceI family protein [Shewanella electrica]